MCGLAAAFHIGTKHQATANEVVVNIYEDQFRRGTEGFGIIRITDLDAPIAVDRATEPTKMMFDLYTKPAPIVLLHHRHPTSSDNFLDQTHPLHVTTGSLQYDYYVMHNGVLSNDRELKKAHEALGFIYQTAYEETGGYYKGNVRFNDSEALAIDLARYIEGQTREMEFRGSAAVLCLQTTKAGVPVAFYFFRDEKSVLAMEKKTGMLHLGSQLPGDDIPANVLYRMAFGDEKMKLQKLPLQIAKAPAPVKQDWHAHSYDSYQGSGYSSGGYSGLRTDRCFEQACREEKIGGSIYCRNHQRNTVDIKDLTVKNLPTPETQLPVDELEDIDGDPQEAPDPTYPGYLDTYKEYEQVSSILDDFFASAEYPGGVSEKEVDETLTELRQILLTIADKSAQHALSDSLGIA